MISVCTPGNHGRLVYTKNERVERTPGDIRAWEQGARIPDGSSRRLLEVVEHDPTVILRAVRDGRTRVLQSTAA